MSAPTGEDALRALLAEPAPSSFLLSRPRLERATVVLDPESGDVVVVQRDEANDREVVLLFPAESRLSVTGMLNATERVAHAPLN